MVEDALVAFKPDFNLRNIQTKNQNEDLQLNKQRLFIFANEKALFYSKFKNMLDLQAKLFINTLTDQTRAQKLELIEETRAQKLELIQRYHLTFEQIKSMYNEKINQLSEILKSKDNMIQKLCKDVEFMKQLQENSIIKQQLKLEQKERRKAPIRKPLRDAAEFPELYCALQNLSSNQLTHLGSVALTILFLTGMRVSHLLLITVSQAFNLIHNYQFQVTFIKKQSQVIQNFIVPDKAQAI
jgi:hypothetical protein